MKKTIYQCDACGEEFGVKGLTHKVKIPIKIQDADGVYLKAVKMELCRVCSDRISEEYYKICKEHKRSGLMGLEQSE